MEALLLADPNTLVEGEDALSDGRTVLYIGEKGFLRLSADMKTFAPLFGADGVTSFNATTAGGGVIVWAAPHPKVHSQLHMATLDGTEWWLLDQAWDNTLPHVSPAGNYIAFISDEQGDHRLKLLKYDLSRGQLNSVHESLPNDKDGKPVTNLFSLEQRTTLPGPNYCQQ